jgi:hypothetical protein
MASTFCSKSVNIFHKKNNDTEENLLTDQYKNTPPTKNWKQTMTTANNKSVE